MDAGFGLNRFDGDAPGEEPGGSIDARGSLLALGCLALLGFGFMRFELADCCGFVRFGLSLCLLLNSLGSRHLHNQNLLQILVPKAFALRRFLFLATFKC